MGDRCCCECCTVRRGTLIIALLWIIGCAIYGFYECRVLQLMIAYPDAGKPPRFPTSRRVMIALSVFKILHILISFVLSCLLLSAYIDKSWRRIVPWLYWNYVALGLDTFLLLFTMIRLGINVHFVAGLVTFTFWAPFLILDAYLIYVVYRYKQELKAN